MPALTLRGVLEGSRLGCDTENWVVAATSSASIQCDIPLFVVAGSTDPNSLY